MFWYIFDQLLISFLILPNLNNLVVHISIGIFVSNIVMYSSGQTINQDFFFGDGEISQIPFDYEHLNNTDTSQDWTLPNEAFEPRHDILTRSAMPPEEFSSKCLSGEMQDSGGYSNNSLCCLW